MPFGLRHLTRSQSLWFTLGMENTCECGCGAPVARRFKPGHDARLKSDLVSAVSAPQWWVRQAAAEALLQRGWLHFAKPEVLASLKVRSRATNGRFVETRHVAVVEAASWTHLDAQGVTHAHPACADAVTPTRPERGRGTGWLCSSCVHTSDWLDLAARHGHDAWEAKAPAHDCWDVPQTA